MPSENSEKIIIRWIHIVLFEKLIAINHNVNNPNAREYCF